MIYYDFVKKLDVTVVEGKYTAEFYTESAGWYRVQFEDDGTAVLFKVAFE